MKPGGVSAGGVMVGKPALGKFYQGAPGSLLTYWTPQYKEVYKAAAVKPSRTIANAQNALIAYLLGANPDSRNTWEKLCCFIPFFAGMPNAADSLIWWNNPTRKGVLSATPPTYEVNRGWTGNGISSYIDTTWNMSVDGGEKYTQNDNSHGHWFLNNSTTSTANGSGVSNGLSIYPFYLNRTYLNIQGSQIYTAATTTRKLTTAIRTSATEVNIFFDKTAQGSTITNNSIALINKTAYVLAINNNGTPIKYQSDTIALVFYGASLDAVDVKNIVDACATLALAILPESTFSDTGDGVSIDTDKWEITNPNPEAVTFSANLGIVMEDIGSSAVTLESNIIKSKLVSNYGTWEFDLLSLVDLEQWEITNYTAIGLFHNTGNKYHLYFYKAGGNLTGFVWRVRTDAHNDVWNTGVLSQGKFKIVITPFGEISLYLYTNDAWVQIGDTKLDVAIRSGVSFYLSTMGDSKTRTIVRDITIRA